MTDSACATRTTKTAITAAVWGAPLTAAQCHVGRPHDTERARLFEHNGKTPQGRFARVCCTEPFFVPDARAQAGSTWLSFDKRAVAAAVTEPKDASLLVRSIEQRRARCLGHLPHVFPDGLGEKPELRSPINGAALQFKPGGT